MWKGESAAGAAPTVVAHRGGAGLAGGDPVAGVRRLIELGVEMVEFDVRTTGDGIHVVHHDPELGGVALGERTHEELEAGGIRLPTLDAFLAAADGRIALDVELKESGHESAVISAVLDTISPDRVVVTSFQDAALIAVKEAVPEIETGLLVGGRAGRRSPGFLISDAFPLERAAACRVDFLAPSYLLHRLGLGARAQRHRLRSLVWSVNRPGQVEQLRSDPGVVGVITDSEALLAGLARQASR